MTTTRRPGPISGNIFSVDLSKKENVFIWFAPRILITLVFFIPAAAQYSDIAESIGASRLCPGVIQDLIWLTVVYYPISIYTFFLSITAALIFIHFNALLAAVILFVLVVFTFIPQLVSACP